MKITLISDTHIIIGSILLVLIFTIIWPFVRDRKKSSHPTNDTIKKSSKKITRGY